MRNELALVLGFFLAGTVAAKEHFARLDWPEGQMRQLPDSCPIRIEIPVGQLFTKDRGGRYTTDKVRAAGCQSSSIQKLRISSEKGRYDPVQRKVAPGLGYHVVIKSDVYLAAGSDKLITLRYRLLLGDTELGSGTEVLEGDQGELNWGDGTQIQLTKVEIGSQSEPVLQIEMTLAPR